MPYVGLPFPEGFEGCYAGEFTASDPNLPPLICLGSTDGKLLFAKQDFMNCAAYPGPASGSGEAINGVARVGNWMAISTPKEVSFWDTTRANGRFLPHGAHGVAATQSGFFIAPLGQAGILIATPSLDDVSLSAHSPGDGSLYVYRVLPLRTEAGSDVVACAARRGGIAAGVLSPPRDATPMKTATFENVDVIDLCPLSPEVDSLALAALGRDGCVILYQNILNDKNPMTFRFQAIKGVAYRIVSHRGDIYVLTSRGLYVLGKLGSRFLRGEATNEMTTPVMPLPMEAIDMSLAWNRWLLIVLADEIIRFDADEIHQFVPQHIGHGEIRELPSVATPIEPQWTETSSTATPLALAS